ncbi:hypothetical protein CCHL11_01572 [Colletotrichum chlorophyti]|uniref:DUF7918 domain-containing protein n=1 Tax=Colletotrichum chlorophyti TaxID=708187 RepID=A0A1Q8RYW1_9PEZI|nr:hypothetical protein CCHL11_01572 [Colletotrichum chlorophyti]
MAVLSELPGVKVTIQVNGQDAAEYDDPDGLESDVNRRCARWRNSRYVESMDNAHFTVKYEVDKNHPWETKNHGLAFYLYIDGRFMDSVFCSADVCVGPDHVWSAVIEGAQEPIYHSSGMAQLSKFKFATISTVDDATKEQVDNDVKSAQSMGLIEVFIHPIVVGAPSYGQSHIIEKNSHFELAEKALKGRAVSHGTSFSNGGLVRAKTTYSAEFLNDKKPIAAFTFKYRSRDALHKELVIPRSPSPSAIDGLSEAEIRRLAAERLDELGNSGRSQSIKRETKAHVIKREFADFLDLTEEPVNREWKKVKIDGNREAIDLTED